MDDLARRTVVLALQDAATTADVAHHVTEIVFGGDDLDLHDRLEQDRAGLVEAFLEAHRAGDLERHFRRVDLMVRTVDQLHLDVDDRIAGKEAVRDRFLDALVDGRDVFLRHDAADDPILELIALALLVRRDLEPDMADLALAARLAHELAAGLERLEDRPAVGDLRLSALGLDVDLGSTSVDEDFPVQPATAGGLGLAAVFVGMTSGRQVLL